MNDVNEASTIESAVFGRLRADVQAIVPRGPLLEATMRYLDDATTAFAARPRQNKLTIYLPIAVAGGRVDEVVEGVAAASTAMYLGARILDDLIDGHRPDGVRSGGGGTELLVGAGLTTTIPSAILAGLPIDPQLLAGLGARLRVGLARLGDGQARDIDTIDRIVSSREVLWAAQGKTGWLLATVAGLSACASGWDDHRIGFIEHLGVAWGTARQLTIDAQKAVLGDSRPLAGLACSYPVASHVESLDQADRPAFETLYEEYVTDGSNADRVLSELAGSGCLERTNWWAKVFMIRAEVFRQALLLDEDADEMITMLMYGGSQEAPRRDEVMAASGKGDDDLATAAGREPDDHGQWIICPEDLIGFLLEKLVIGSESETARLDEANVAAYIEAADRASLMLPADGSLPSQEQLAAADQEFENLITRTFGWDQDYGLVGPQAVSAIREIGMRFRRTAANEPAAFLSLLVTLKSSGEILVW